MRKKISLTPQELRAGDAFMAKLQLPERKTKGQIAIALIGMVGAGKSSAAKELAPLIGAAIIEWDAIRVCLRKEREGYENTWRIAEEVTLRILKQGINVIVDSDHSYAKPRGSLKRKLARIGVKLIFIHVICDFDVMTGRVMSADYKNSPEDFFGGSETLWQGSEQSRGAVAKLRAMWRRTPLHYTWISRHGGTWIPRKLRLPVFAVIDSTDTLHWKKQVQAIAKTLRDF